MKDFPGGVKYFNSRPCGRGDLGFTAEGVAKSLISIHAPAGGATDLMNPINTVNLFQFTPLREGRRKERNGNGLGRPISIHAPAGGATVNIDPLGGEGLISIHAPAGGATARLAGLFAPTIFQFTPLREGRPERVRPPAQARIYFNSRPCGRGDGGNRRCDRV